MKTIIDNYNIECFENEKDYKLWLKDHQKESFMNKVVYSGPLYGIPKQVKNKFSVNLVVEIKKQNHNDIQFIFIYR